MLRTATVTILALALSAPALALDGDSEQPATLDADDMELDFATGQRIYRGNVVFRQGSLKLDCDELTTTFNDAGDLDQAVCVGSPSRFKQRPEGAEEDVVGTASTITMDRVNDLVTLKSQAKVVQGGTTITGRLITYDLTTEKASIKGGSTQTAGSGEAAPSPAPETEESEQAADAGTTESAAVQNEGSSRPSLTIQPRKKPSEEATTENAGEAAATGDASRDGAASESGASE